MIPALIEDLRSNGVDVSKGIPQGITRNSRGEAICYFKGPELEDKKYMEVDTLLGLLLTLGEVSTFADLDPTNIYYHSLDWDTMEAGFVDIKKPGGKFRYYFTMHQPTNEVNWYRKIKGELKGGGYLAIWEKFDKENYNGFIADCSDDEIINVKGELG